MMLLKTKKNWIKFLDASVAVYKYDFKEQLMIAAQKPEATAVADIDFWNRRTGRYVNKGTKGIALFTERNKNTKSLRYVFDISDTTKVRANAQDITPWELLPEDQTVIANKLLDLSSIQGSDTSRIEDAVYILVSNTVNDQNEIDELIDSTIFKGSAFYPLKDKNLQHDVLQNLVIASTTYVILKRCGIDPESVIAPSEFEGIKYLNTRKALINVGNLCTDYAQNILRVVERQVHLLKLQHEKEVREQKKRETSESIQQLIDEHEQDQETTIDDSKEVLIKEETINAISGESKDSVTIETVSEKLTNTDEIQLSLFPSFPTEEEQKGTILTDNDIATPVIKAEIITDDLINTLLMSVGGGSIADERRLEIVDFWQKGYSLNNFSAFLMQKIGERSQGFTIDDQNVTVSYNHEGMKISMMPSAINNPMKELNWKQVASRVDKLIRTGHFLNRDEAANIQSHMQTIIAEKLCYFLEDYSDIKDELVRSVGLIERNSAPERIDEIKKLLVDSDKTENIALIIERAALENPDNERLNALKDMLDHYQLPSKDLSFSARKKTVTYESFITEDEVAKAIRDTLDPKEAVKFFVQSKDLSEEIKYLKDHYGDSGIHTHWNPIEEFTSSRSKGIKIAKKTPTGDELDIQLNYRQVAKFIHKLIDQNRFILEENIQEELTEGIQTEEKTDNDEVASQTDLENFKEPEVQENQIECFIGFSESAALDYLDSFEPESESNPVSFALANKIFGYLDQKQHTEREIYSNIGWYNKTDFRINAVINGKSYGYEGRFDIGDGEGDLIDHIDNYYQYILADDSPMQRIWKSDGILDEKLENAKDFSQNFVPFLRANSTLNQDDQKRYDAFLVTEEHWYNDIPLELTESEYIRRNLSPGTFFQFDNTICRVDSYEYEPSTQHINMVKAIDVKKEQNGEQSPERFFTSDLLYKMAIEGGESFFVTQKQLPEEAERPYHVGDKVFIDDVEFEITDITQNHVQLLDKNLHYPVYRSESKENFEQLIRQDIRNMPVMETAEGSESILTVLENTMPSETGNYQININEQQNSDSFRPKERFEGNIKAIETLNHIAAEGRSATEDEKTIINQYVGWGGLADVFDERKTEWSAERERLQSLLSDVDYQAAEESVLNAHYTNPSIIYAMYQAIEGFGFTGGNILDKTTPRLIQFHTLKNAVNPPFLGGFSIFNTVVA